MTTTPTRTPRWARRVLELAESDAQLQELMPDEAVLEAVLRRSQSLEEMITAALDGYAGRPALGEREYEVVLDRSTGRRDRQYVPRFGTITYYELHNRIKALTNAWRNHTHHRVDEGDFVCILGFSGTDFVTVDLACVYTRAVNVPLQTTLAGADLDGIFTDTEPTVVAATVTDLVLAAELAGSHPSIRSIIAMDYDDRVDGDREQLALAETELAQTRSAAQLVTLDELIAFGDFQTWEPLPPLENPDERMAMLLHSSGSTGTPKGAIVLERNAKPQFTAVPPVPVPIVRLVFAPMNHFLGRGQVFTTMARGGTAYFTARSDMSTLFEDFRLSRPTEAAIFPRVLDMIHRHYLGEVARRRAVEPGSDEEIGTRVMEEMRYTYLGDRISMVVAGGAPTAPEVERFVTQCFPVTLIDGYGTTEAGGSITVKNRVSRPPVIDYKLRDVPELGYYTTDKPYPRGELCVKTELSVPGYFKRPEATAALFDEEGYLRTGDIMEEREPDYLVYVDRRNDVLKLAQGEFVAAGALGNIYENGSELVHQIYIYGNAARAYLVAVVVPNLELVERTLGSTPSDAELKALIRSELRNVAESENLRSFEVPRDFIVELEPFSHENGLLSSIHKRLRPALLRRYGERLEQLYTELERKQNDQLMALRDPQSELSVLDKVGKALEATLGVEDVDVTLPYTFADLGGDSLGAAAFSSLLSDMFGIEVPVNTILSPAGNPQQWARSIEAALHGERAQPTFAGIHGEGARQLNAKDLDIVNFLDAQVLEQATMEEPPAVSRTVLLTGANGFLGRFLCLEWLERVATNGGTVFCLIRAADQEAATQRLAAAFTGDPALEKRFHELASNHLQIVVGDVAEPRLGLDDATYDRLAHEVDRIVHPAALVNHMLDYEYLFGPNVAGTAELVALALMHRQKRVDFVSSLAATWLVERSGGVDEDSPLRQNVVLSHDYSSGYAASKWAAEHLLHSAHRRFGVPVNVFRGDMMLPHSRYAKQVNVPDVFIRLLYSVVTTGLAPLSFYELEPDGSRARAHYDGLPVDFVAAAMTGISETAHRVITTFHVINHHEDDGISLDTIVDWIEAAGYPIERVESHREWVQRFEEKLKALPEAQRQHTSLTVLDSLRHPYRAHQPLVGSARFVDGVGRVQVGPEVPHLSQEYIEKCLDDLRQLGLIGDPESDAGASARQAMAGQPA